MLGVDGRRVSVTDAVLTPIGTGQTGATYRIGVRYGTPAPGLPDSFVIKLPAQDAAVRDRVALSYRSEHAFYTEVADTLAVPLPAAITAASAMTAPGSYCCADMAPARQGDQIRAAPAEARVAVIALAGLHGPRWCDPNWLEFTGTVMPKADEPTARGLGEITIMAARSTVEELGDRMTPPTVRRCWTPPSASPTGCSPPRNDSVCCTVTTDSTICSSTRPAPPSPWSTGRLAVGLPARDLAYFVATSLHPDDRAAAERARAELSPCADRVRGGRLRRRNLLAGLSLGNAAGAADHHARVRLLRANGRGDECS